MADVALRHQSGRLSAMEAAREAQALLELVLSSGMEGLLGGPSAQPRTFLDQLLQVVRDYLAEANAALDAGCYPPLPDYLVLLLLEQEVKASDRGRAEQSSSGQTVGVAQPSCCAQTPTMCLSPAITTTLAGPRGQRSVPLHRAGRGGRLPAPQHAAAQGQHAVLK